MFGGSAVDAFLTANHDSHVFRAHQEECAGIKLCKSARVVTIFSSSGYVGHDNCAGLVFVGQDGQLHRATL